MKNKKNLKTLIYRVGQCGQNFTRRNQAVLAAVTLFIVGAAHADFLQMPDITQTREIQNKSLIRDVDIPAVRDRDPDPNAGPRIAVKEFKIQGLVEYPKLGITREALNELAEKIRFKLMDEGTLLQSGYTIKELGELSDLLVKIDEETEDRHVTPMDVQRLVWLVRDQRGKRGITIGQIESVANTITRFYRERGFVLAKAYIPKQHVRDGIVNLTVLLGMLGDVKVQGNKIYSTDDLKDVFSDMVAKPVTNAAVEEDLFLINSFPGIVVDGYFEPGYQVGDTRLNINVKNESRYNADIRVDNHGTPESGLYRIYVDGQVNNALGMADMLQASYLKALHPDNTDYYKLSYELNLFSPRTRFGVETSKNQFVVDQSSAQANLDLHGSVFVDAVTAKYIQKRSRLENKSYELRYEKVKSDLQIGNIPDINNALDEKLSNTSLAYNFDFLQEEKRRLHQGKVKITFGSFDFGVKPNQDASYKFLNGDYSLLTFWKVPWVDANTRVIYRAGMQYSGINLSPIVRYSLAGPTRARGFSPSIFTADDAVYLGIDWLFNSPGWFDFNITKSINFKQITKPFLFADYAYGIQHTLTGGEGDAKATLSDAGFGLQFSYSNNFSGNLMVAFPITRNITGTTVTPEKDNYRVVFDFQYSF
ncbi:MAG: ShlB/FhaC/HecB family hemolysin secretion/activation protein [Gammaproteobacteria bacterium]|nr:ShlB/FhaC/HecB family hemolysin secretion/activation protein [Gammaproteobacteria bacterium]